MIIQENRSKFMIVTIIQSVLCLVLFYLLYDKSSPTANQPTHHIAIVIPASHPSIESICKGFEDTLRNTYSLNADYTVFNGNGNRALIKSQIEEVVQGDYDLIFTVGMLTSVLAKETTAKKKHLTPIVFSAVARPVEMNLVHTLASSGNNATGIADQQNYETQMRLLQALKPNVKTVLLVYNPQQGSGLEHDKEQISKILEQKNITLKTVEVYNTNEIYGKVSGALNGVDVVLVLTDNTVVSAIDSLVKLCNRSGVTLYTSELDSINRGAGMGCGVVQHDFGILAAKQAAAILQQGKQPSELPIQHVEKMVLQINAQTMKQQNIELSDRERIIAEFVELVNP